jgi:hypothetical protein
LPPKIILNAIRFIGHNNLIVGDYFDLLTDNIYEVTDKGLVPLREIENDKVIVTKAYNKKVKAKSFQIRDLI